MAALPSELPADGRDVRSRILGQAPLLAYRAEGSLKFVGSEQDQPREPSHEILAIEVARIDLAQALCSARRSDARLSSMNVRLPQLLRAMPAAEFSATLFP